MSIQPYMRKRVLIKYIHLSDTTNPKINTHTLEQYEYKKTIFEHSSYEHMVSQVKALCPPEFQCVYPVALHHEIIWTLGKEQDKIYRPIDAVDYDLINWRRHPVTPVCVEIMRAAELTAAEGPVALLAAAPPLGRPRLQPDPEGVLRLR